VTYLVESLLGFGLMFIFAMLMYYTGQWGGGDSKMIMGLGALIGLSIPSLTELIFDPPFLVLFILYSMVIGAVYGLVWSAVLAWIHRREFAKELLRYQKTQGVTRLRMILIAFAAIAIAASFFVPHSLRSIFLSLVLVILVTYFLFIFVKVIEKTCMLKRISPDRLTPGDWIAEDVVVDNKRICGPKDLGIEKHQILLLQNAHKKRKIDTVLVKEGIPFVPSFLLAFFATLFIGMPISIFLH
jgi:hypothetical protein